MVTFSAKLKSLLDRKERLTFQTLLNAFAEKSFSILFLFLLAIPALPLPTGGATHVLEIIAMLLAIELLTGRKTVWLPKKWLHKTLPDSLQTSALPKFIKIIAWIEKFSKPRLQSIHRSNLYAIVYGAMTLLFVLAAFLAPPFSGLDTAPSVGVVLLSLGSILDDGLLSFIGIAIGVTGIVLIIFLGKLVFQLL